MKKKIIPNKMGLPCNEKGSPKVRTELNKWEELSKRKNLPRFSHPSLWREISACNAL